VEQSDQRNAGPRPGTPPAVGDTLFAVKGWFWYPLVPLVVLDLWSKAWAFDYVQAQGDGNFSPLNSVPVWRENGLLDFELVTWLNRGTIWGLGADWHEPLKILRVGAIALILYFVYRTLTERRVMLVSLSLILAGALGNMYDNFIHVDPAWGPKDAGAVRDFLHFFNKAPTAWWGVTWDFPAFNVADSCITVGAITLFILLWRTPADELGAQKPGT
jgi:signal peptidase II